MANRYRALQQFFKYLQVEGELRESPMRNMRPPRVIDNPPHTASDDEMQRLLASCAGSTFTDRRDTAILTLFYDAGMRRAEMAGIKTVDVDLAAKTVRVTGKGGRIRDLAYGRGTARALDRYRRVRARHKHADDPAFWLGQTGGLSAYGIEQLVKRRATRVGLPHIHCHTLRHGWANAFLASGGNEGDLAQLAGWRSRQMVDRYSRSVAGARARANFAAHSPIDALRAR